MGNMAEYKYLKYKDLLLQHSSVSFIKQIPQKTIVPANMQRAGGSTTKLLPSEAGSHLRLF